MASENETIADIVAEFREMVHQSVDGIIAVKADVIADRIEAAWRREKAEAEAAALSAGGIVEALRHKPGNAAAWREALVFLRDKELSLLEGNVRHCIGLTVFGLEQACKIMRGVIEEALSAPPRNCDCHKDADSAYIAFCGYDFAAKDISDSAFIDWLFAPAAERKGEGDGR